MKPLVRLFVAKMANKKKLKRFDDCPAMFFESLTNKSYRFLGLIFFGRSIEFSDAIKHINKKESVERNVLIKYSYYENGPLGTYFRLQESIRAGYGVILIERASPLTLEEMAIYGAIENNHNNIYSLRRRHLHRVEFDDAPQQASYHAAGRSKVIDRLGPKGREIISKFSFVLCVNPTTEFSTGLRSLGSNICLIAIYTPDFDVSTIRESLADVDVAIGSNLTLGQFSNTRVRRYEFTDGIEQTVQVLGLVLQELMPKELEAYIQIKGDRVFDETLIDNDLSQVQVIMSLKLPAEQALIVTGNFVDYLEELTPYIDKLLVSDTVFFRYRTLLLDLEHCLFDFLSMALLDGVRFDVRFSDPV